MRSKLILLLLLITGLNYGQNKLGVYGGYNNSVLGNGFLKDTEGIGTFTNSNNNHGLHLGALYAYELTDKITFSPGLVFSIQGDDSNHNFEGSSNFIPSSYNLSYLNAPLNFNFFSKPYIIIGPQLGVLIAHKKGEADYGDPKEFDLGINGGIGYNFSNKLFVEFKLYQGLQTVLVEPSGSIPPGDDKN